MKRHTFIRIFGAGQAAALLESMACSKKEQLDSTITYSHDYVIVTQHGINNDGSPICTGTVPFCARRTKTWPIH